MGEVFHVDEDMVTRTTNWLVEQQSADGSWAGNKQTETFAIHGRLLQTAYVVWALSEIGYTGEAGKKGMAYIRANWKDVSDPYLLALVAAAGTGTDLDDLWSSRRLDELEALKKTSADGKTMWWDGSASVTGSGGGSLSIESTSLAALTMMKMKRYPQSVLGALEYLVGARDSLGSWSTTQATILTLRTLLEAETFTAKADVSGSLSVSLNGGDATSIEVSPETSDIVRLVDLRRATREGENTLSVSSTGDLPMLYQVVTRYFTPWPDVPVGTAVSERLGIELTYDRTHLAQDDRVTATVDAVNTSGEFLGNVMLILGIPAGFAVDTPTLDEWVTNRKIAKYTLSARQITIYLEGLNANEVKSLTYTLRAKFPVKVTSPETIAYEYYRPEKVAVSTPVVMTVE
jgi:hypothetical protein